MTPAPPGSATAPAPGVAPGTAPGVAPRTTTGVTGDVRSALTLLETLLAATILSASVGSTALVLRESSSRSAMNALQRDALEALKHRKLAADASGSPQAERGAQPPEMRSWTDARSRTWHVVVTDDDPPLASRPASEDEESPLFLWRRIDVVLGDPSGPESIPALTLWRLLPPPPPEPPDSHADSPPGAPPSLVPPRGGVTR